MIVQLAVAGAILAHTLLALEARLVVVVRLEGLEAHPARARSASGLLFGSGATTATAAGTVIVVVQIAAGLLLLLLLLLLIAG